MTSFELLHRTYEAWCRDKATRLAAATAYYTIFSLAPLLIIVISVTGLIVNEADVQQAIFDEIEGLIGPEGAGAVRTMIEASSASPRTPLAAIVGIVMLMLGASGLLLALQDAFNTIWSVRPKQGTNAFHTVLLKRAFSFGMILSMGFLLLVSLVVSSMLGFTVTFLTDYLTVNPLMLVLMNESASFLFIAILFAVLFKFLPDIRIPWRAVVPGALLTAFLFTIGKFLLGFYLGQKDFLTVYGVAGSIILLLVWIYYSAQILFFGAEFTKIFALSRGIAISPRKHAQFIVAPRLEEAGGLSAAIIKKLRRKRRC